jgi:hypothetical protein
MPPGRTAENWSRRDGIRAGSVSGPWRSAPREAGRAPAADPRPQVVPVVRRRDRRPRIMPLGGWIAVAVVAAAGIVLAAVLMRPQTPAAPAPAEVAAELPAPSPADAVAEAAPAAADPALTGVSVVRLRVGPEFPAEREAALLDALRAAGISGVRVETVPFRVATSRVGYYRADDLAAAEALGRLVTPVLSETIGVRDYGKLLADAEPGRLDLWVEG